MSDNDRNGDGPNEKGLNEKGLNENGTSDDGTSDDGATGNDVIVVRGLRKRYGPRLAVDDVSFAVREGEVFGIVGPNGAGKTTVVECLLGLRARDGGTVAVLGHDPASDPVPVHEQVGAQLQESRLPDRLRVGEAMALFASFYRDPADVGELLARTELAEHRDQPYRALSGGQKQRLAVALALVGGPRIVVFDELTTGLDPAARRRTWRLVRDVRAAGVTVLLVTHFMEEAELLCDRVALVDAGRIVALGPPSGLVVRATAERPGAGVRTLDDAYLVLTGQALDQEV